MKLHGTMSINQQGHLTIGGCDAVELVREFGTPLYVMDEQLMRENCRAYVQAFAKWYPHSEVIFASKAFCNLSMCRLIAEENMGLDVVSGGELYTALHADFPVSRIYMHGNNKSVDELELAIGARIGRIVVDNLYELELIDELARQKKTKVKILLRVQPGIDAHTHHYIKTGTLDSKFGLGISNGQALVGIKKALQLKHVELKGIHCHIGSQIFDLDSYSEAAQIMMGFVKEIYEQTGFQCEELDLGGGMGIYYSEGDTPRKVSDMVQRIAAGIKECAARDGIKLPKVIVEPGRSIVGEAGITLYSVGTIKEIPDVRKYIAVDGGMTDNPRPALYQAKYEAALANRMNECCDDLVSIAGKCCESGDMLIWDLSLPQAVPNDILVVSSTGAYNYSMASNYNRNLRPAVVFAIDGQARLVVRRESYEDIIQHDVMPVAPAGQKVQLA